MSKQLDMLNNVLDTIIHGKQLSTEDAFLELMDFIGYEVNFESSVSTPWTNVELRDKIEERLNLDVLREDPWDWIGELYEDRGLNLIGTKGKSFVSRSEAVNFSKAYRPQGSYARIKDSCCGSGRMIITIYNTIGNQTVFYGVEPDLILYRMALLNINIYGIHAKILSGNKELHDTREHSPNWRYANEWVPTKHSRLLTEADVNEYEAERQGV